MNGASGEEGRSQFDGYTLPHPCGSGGRLARRSSAATGFIARAQKRSPVMAIAHHISLLKNELHYAEKEKLANWRKAFQQSLQRTVPQQAQFARYRVRKTKKAFLAVRR